jgi:hypothetical protein
MMNWIYTWYNPRVDGDAEELSRGLGNIFLRGIAGAGERQPARGKASQKKKAASN